MPYFEEAPECEVGQPRQLRNACGVCGTGTRNEVCGEDRRWREDEAHPCDDLLDRDGDGYANEACGEDCCTTDIDCNDADPAEHAAVPECTYRESPGEPDHEPCAMPCPDGGTGTRTCTPSCSWGDCVFPDESDGSRFPL
jgi:hypothetical protein